MREAGAGFPSEHLFIDYWPCVCVCLEVAFSGHLPDPMVEVSSSLLPCRYPGLNSGPHTHPSYWPVFLTAFSFYC